MAPGTTVVGGPSQHVTWPGDGGAKCDPWLDSSWCESDGDGDCMTSQLPAGSEEGVLGACGPGGTIGGRDGGTGSPNPTPADTACTTLDPALNDAAVQTGLRDLWQQSGIDKPQDQRAEAGGWIVRNTDGSHRLVPLSDMVREPCRLNGNWLAPLGTVGFVHTHPFRSHEVMIACGPVSRELPDGRSIPILGKNGQYLYHTYSNRPSPADRDLLQNVVNNIRRLRGESALQGYVIDNERITQYTGTNNREDKPYGRCGY